MITKNSLVNNRLELLQTRLKSQWFVFEEFYDLYYLTQLKMSKATLVVGKYPILFADSKYVDTAKKNCFFEVKPLEDFGKWLKEEKVETLLFDPEVTSYQRYEQLKKAVDVHPGKNPLQELRMIKSKEEIAAMQQSAELLMKGFTRIQSFLEEGITEREVAKAFEIFCLKEGADKLAFEPIIAFGAHSAMPHYRAGDGVLKKGDIVLVDIGVVVADYASDMTRTFFFGQGTSELEKIYDLVQATYQEVVSHICLGVSVKKLDSVSREYMKAHTDYPVLHSVGHGIGLEVHEAPSVSIKAVDDVPLQKNMVITIEPGIYIPGVGGVRHENMLLIEEHGFKNFYNKLNIGKTL